MVRLSTKKALGTLKMPHPRYRKWSIEMMIGSRMITNPILRLHGRRLADLQLDEVQLSYALVEEGLMVLRGDLICARFPAYSAHQRIEIESLLGCASATQRELLNALEFPVWVKNAAIRGIKCERDSMLDTLSSVRRDDMGLFEHETISLKRVLPSAERTT